jgi:hypothetical protein
MHHIADDAVFIFRVMPENFKGISIKTVKSILGAKPQKSLLILQAAVNGVV